MIRLLCWDLDGVIADLCGIHRKALNNAIRECAGAQYGIGCGEEHIYEALPTKTKLEMLHKNKGLPREHFDCINSKKQEYTLYYIEEGFPIHNECEIIHKLYNEDKYLMAVCSNSVRKTIELTLEKLRIRDMVDLIVSNEDVKNPKPHPECYTKAMNYFKTTPRETVVFEDSPKGIMAGFASRAWVFPVKNPASLDYDLIKSFIGGIDENESK